MRDDAWTASLARLQHRQTGEFEIGPLAERRSWAQGSLPALHIATNSKGLTGMISLWDGYCWKTIKEADNG